MKNKKQLQTKNLSKSKNLEDYYKRKPKDLRIKNLIEKLEKYDKNLLIETLQDGCGVVLSEETKFKVIDNVLYIDTDGGNNL